MSKTKRPYVPLPPMPLSELPMLKALLAIPPPAARDKSARKLVGRTKGPKKGLG